MPTVGPTGVPSEYPEAARQVVASDVGERVTVRRRVPGGFSDTIGVLQNFTPGYAELRRSNGELVHIKLADIVASRVVGSR